MATSAQQAIADAKQALHNAEAIRAHEERQENEQKLREAMTAGRVAKTEYLRLERQFKRAEAEATLAQAEVDTLNQQLADHTYEKPDVVEFPTDGEIRAWESEHLQLTQARDQAVVELKMANAKRDQLRLPAMEAADRQVHQERIVRNLQSKIDDPKFPRGWQSSLSPA